MTVAAVVVVRRRKESWRNDSSGSYSLFLIPLFTIFRMTV